MNDFKSMLASRTVWAGLVGILFQFAVILGVPEAVLPDQAQFVEAIVSSVNGILFLGAIVFRILASKKLAAGPGGSALSLWALALVLVLMLSAALAPRAAAHELWTNKERRVNAAGEWCCNSYDCARASARETAKGYLFDTGELVPRAEVMLSGDGDFWLCRRPDKTVRCAFAPLGA